MMNIEETKQRMREVLQETIDYYDSPEKFGYSREKQHCVYLDKDTGAMCAFGRCAMNPEELPKDDAGISDIFRSSEDIDDVLKKEYRGFPMDFWEQLQSLHDHSSDFPSITAAMNKTYYAKFVHKTVINVIEEYPQKPS